MQKKLQNLISIYNNQNNILVVSSYPEKKVKYSSKVCAVGGYVKNTIEGLRSYFSSNIPRENNQKKFVVLTVIIDKEEIYEEDGVLVWRVFKRDSAFSYIKLLKAVRKFPNIKNVLVEFEFASFGDTKTSGLFPLLIIALKILKKNTVLVLHQVLADLSVLLGHLGWSKNDLRIKFFSPILKAFYWSLTFFSDKVVVLEVNFRQKLVEVVGMSDKIVYIPHGVDNNMELIDKMKARKKLGMNKSEHVVLYFGYATWYKGVDLLAKAFSKQKIVVRGKPARLIIAGGESTTQKRKQHYQQFFWKVNEIVRKSQNITMTGFVKEQDIPLYFNAADIVILPYRTFMSSSGPLSLAFSFRKPILLSSRLSKYFDSSDFLRASTESGISKKDLIFSFAGNNLLERITKMSQDTELRNGAEKFSDLMAKQRNFDTIAESYANAFSWPVVSHKEISLLRSVFRPLLVKLN